MKLDSHVGRVNSAHNQVVKKSEDPLKEKQHIESVLVKQSNKDKLEYRVQLNVIVDYIIFLLSLKPWDLSWPRKANPWHKKNLMQSTIAFNWTR